MRYQCRAGRHLPQLRSARRSTHGTRTNARTATSIFTLAPSLVLLVLAGVIASPGQAGAASPQIAQIWAHDARVTSSPVPHLAPNESVTVKVPENSVLQAGYRADILMCSDPGGKASALPISDSTCDGLTINNGRTLDIGTKGTVNKKDYVIYKLPLKIEGSDSIPKCNATHACVLYVGQDQNDFAHPHVWSTAFYVGTATKRK